MPVARRLLFTHPFPETRGAVVRVGGRPVSSATSGARRLPPLSARAASVMLEPFLFFVFAVLAVSGGLGMLIARSPIASALWMVMGMIAIAGLYLTLNAAFIGVVQILVYAGAIMVLFLFVIMLLNLDETPRLASVDWRKGAAFVLGVAVLAQLLAVVAVRVQGAANPGTTGAVAQARVAATDVDALGVALLTDHAFSLEIIGVLLLGATIGAVLLAKKKLT